MINCSSFKSILTLIGFVSFCFFYAKAQYLTNPSLEGFSPPHGVAPPNWSTRMQTPDRQPGFACVTFPAFNGNSYMALAKISLIEGLETAGQPLSKS